MTQLAGHSLRPLLVDDRYVGEMALARQAMLTPPKSAFAGYTPSGEGWKPYDVVDGVAIIGVYGYLEHCAPWWGSRYFTGYDQLRYLLDFAFADSDVKGIVLDIRSGGGDVSGCFDFCDWLVAQKAKTGKPIVAICSEHAFSAAYAPASCCDSISVPRTGGVGSIGVVLIHTDLTKAFEKWGETNTIIRAGKLKFTGSYFEPLSDETKQSLAAEVEATRKLFAATVVAGRATAGVTITIDQVLATEGRTYDGPEMTAEAVRLGLADAVMAPSVAFAAFRDAVNS